MSISKYTRAHLCYNRVYELMFRLSVIQALSQTTSIPVTKIVTNTKKLIPASIGNITFAARGDVTLIPPSPIPSSLPLRVYNEGEQGEVFLKLLPCKSCISEA